MTRKTMRQIEQELESLEERESNESGLRQKVPVELIEEWAGKAGRDMGWIHDLESDS